MIKTSVPGQPTTDYVYDGDGRRVAKKQGGSTVDTMVYGGGKLLEDTDRRYVYGVGLEYSLQITVSFLSVYHHDGMGAVRARSDATGLNVVHTYTADEFGVQATSDQSGDLASGQPFGTGPGFINPETPGQSFLQGRLYKFDIDWVFGRGGGGDDSETKSIMPPGSPGCREEKCRSKATGTPADDPLDRDRRPPTPTGGRPAPSVPVTPADAGEDPPAALEPPSDQPAQPDQIPPPLVPIVVFVLRILGGALVAAGVLEAYSEYATWQTGEFCDHPCTDSSGASVYSTAVSLAWSLASPMVFGSKSTFGTPTPKGKALWAEKLPKPPTPEGMSQPQLGKLIGWGEGYNEPVARIRTIDVDALWNSSFHSTDDAD